VLSLFLEEMGRMEMVFAGTNGMELEKIASERLRMEVRGCGSGGGGWVQLSFVVQVSKYTHLPSLKIVFILTIAGPPQVELDLRRDEAELL
jgi:hypothetical protein